MELVLLHALPLDGSMWHRQMELLPDATHAPTLYGLGNTLSQWAAAILDQVQDERLIVAGNSVGGSCALEMAVLAPHRIGGLVLIGAKAGHRPEPDLHAAVNAMLRDEGVEAAWEEYWAPLFSRSSSPEALALGREIVLGLSADEIAKGVTAFHTRTDRAELLPALRCPLLCIAGEHDIKPYRAKERRTRRATDDHSSCPAAGIILRSSSRRH